MKIKDVMEIQRFFILSVISYKSCSHTSFSWCWELGKLEFQKFFWIPLTNTIILKYNMPMLWRKLKKLWAFKYFLLEVFIPISYKSCSGTLMASRFGLEVLWLILKIVISNWTRLKVFQIFSEVKITQKMSRWPNMKEFLISNHMFICLI